MYCIQLSNVKQIFKKLNICYSSVRFSGEPLVVSCERTVRVGGGLVAVTNFVCPAGKNSATMPDADNFNWIFT